MPGPSGRCVRDHFTPGGLVAGVGAGAAGSDADYGGSGDSDDGREPTDPTQPVGFAAAAISGVGDQKEKEYWEEHSPSKQTQAILDAQSAEEQDASDRGWAKTVLQGGRSGSPTT